MQKIWNLKSFDASLSGQLEKALKISPILARILVNRKIFTVEDAENFLFADIADCYDPFLMKGIDIAVNRINDAINRKENIMLYGDYDVDGITSIALLKTVLDDLGANTMSYIPNRLEEGYGLNKKAIKLAQEKQVSLIITADCGIDAIEEVKYANSLMINVIITDHHEIKDSELPPAYTIVNPHQSDCRYPFKALAGVGVVYKLLQALTKGKSYPLEKHLDFVALGTVSDVVPQRSENRIFTKFGIKALSYTEKVGLKSLICISGLLNKEISCSDIGYIIGPRINAMGRIGSPDVALRLLLTSNKLEADKLADMLNKENATRQKIESKILEEAIQKVEHEINFKENKIIVLAEDKWHPGVIGIVASRIQDKFYRPTILISFNGEIGKGSGRSIEKFHLFEALMYSKDCLLEFGGHESACGLVIHRNELSRFIEKINNYAKDKINGMDLFPILDIDADVNLDTISEGLIEELAKLGPYGPDNPRPVFVSSNVALRNEPKFIGKNGFKMWVKGDTSICEAISFKRDTVSIPRAGQVFDLVYSPSINKWQGIESIQLDIKDIRISG